MLLLPWTQSRQSPVNIKCLLLTHTSWCTLDFAILSHIAARSTNRICCLDILFFASWRLSEHEPIMCTMRNTSGSGRFCFLCGLLYQLRSSNFFMNLLYTLLYYYYYIYICIYYYYIIIIIIFYYIIYYYIYILQTTTTTT